MTTTLQIRIDKKTKDAAQKTFRAMGLDMSSGVKLYLTQVMHSKSIPFPVFSFDYLPREKKLQLIKEAKYALKHGKRYATIAEAHRDILGGK
jgi:DNA-damage-inducible protein J